MRVIFDIKNIQFSIFEIYTKFEFHSFWRRVNIFASLKYKYTMQKYKLQTREYKFTSCQYETTSKKYNFTSQEY